jgi:membrane protease YdiL (CAAX protease family)
MSVDATRAASSRATERPGQRVARWRAPGALATVVAAIVVGQGVAVGVQLLAGSGPASRSVVGSVAVVLAYLATLGVVLSVARRGADRLAPATLGIRRTRLGPALGWGAAIYFGVVAVEGLWSALVGGPARGGVHHHHAAAGTAVLVLVAGAVVAPIAEEITFRGYLFPALARWRGPWVGALLCAALFGAVHLAVYPVEFLPALAVFGFGQCLLFWFSGSLLPCVALHALNNAVVMALLLGVGGLVPVAAVLAPAVAVALLWPLARERAPRPA